MILTVRLGNTQDVSKTAVNLFRLLDMILVS